MPAEEMIEFVVKADCLCDGTPFYRGETKTLPQSLFNELKAAGRVCNEEEAAIARAAAAAVAPPVEGGDGKPKGKGNS